MITGRCQCGAVRYQHSGTPTAIYVCHCQECRRQSASAFGISFIVPYASLRLTQGTPKLWSRPSDTGNTLDCAFCPDCGSRLWHRWRGSTDTISVKGGSLDEPVDLRQAVHIWTSRLQPGITILHGATQFSAEPRR